MNFPSWQRRRRESRWRPMFLVAAFFVALTIRQDPPHASPIPPSASLVMQLPDKSHLHMLALPLGRLDGAIKGEAHFDASGSRAVFVATFPGATLNGDWRSLDPIQAFILDAGRRTLTQLTIDGQARAANWEESGTVVVWDGSRRNRYSVTPPSDTALPALRMANVQSAKDAAVVARGGDGRFLVAKTAGGRYAVEQVGARSLRYHGTAGNGAYAIAGNFLVWVDTSKSPGVEIARNGAQDAVPPSFGGSAYGDSLAPIVPLGHSVYQGAYRNGAAYFAFTNGMRRIVAQTDDLVTYSFPQVPNNLSYTVGDGFGADANGGLYFGRPESDEVTFWRAGRYVHQALTFPTQAGSENALEWAMARIAPGDPLWPALRPDEDALDTALLQWRMYPVGDEVGERWIASYLGRIMIGDARGNFRFAAAPQYPFAVLGRTDDGRLWGASPQLRFFTQAIFAETTSMLWWSRDGVDWLEAGKLPGDAGAVGLDHRQVWIALTRPWQGRASISIMRLDDATAAITGGTYSGEQLFFASLSSGFFLVWGATPGRRLNGDQGPLCAFRIDQSELLALAGDGSNVFARQLLNPENDPSLPSASFDAFDSSALVQPTLDVLASLPNGVHATLATNAGGVQVDQKRVTLMSFDQERAFEIKYALRPYPLASVRVSQSGAHALVARSLARGPLAAEGATERWTRVNGRWRRSSAARWTTEAK